MSARLLPHRRAPRPSDALPQREPWWVGLAFIGFSLLFCLLLAQTALGAPLRTHKPASDIRWYRVTDVGSLLVGAEGALYAPDGDDRRILSKDKEPDYQVDEPAGRVFNLRNSKELSAFAADAAPPAHEKKN